MTTLVIIKMIVCGIVAGGLIPPIARSWAEIIGSSRWAYVISNLTVFALLYLVTEVVRMLPR